MNVVKLETERLYAAYDSPLVANQTDSNTFDVPGDKKENYTILKSEQNLWLAVFIANKTQRGCWSNI